MRKYILILLLSIGCVTLAQSPEIKTDLPTIIPPSPTVASLMKFEEVPVSNYTGIPDISIPLFTTSTLSKDINLEVSLKYHPSGVAVEERASDVGLGWSLFAGGTISRTVRGLPDEINSMGDNKFGLYQNSSTNIHNNNYYYEAFDALTEYLGATGNYDITWDTLRKCLWDAKVRGEMDSEHDLWQFNFMGKSGRFYIKKNLNNQLEVTPLDDYRLKIINYYGNTSNQYLPTSFVIFDEKGYKYTFDVIETTTQHSFSLSISSTTYEDSGPIPSPSTFYNSSFHLSTINDNQGNLVVEFLYDSTFKEKVLRGSTTYFQEDYRNRPPNKPSLRDFYLGVNQNIDPEYINLCQAGVNDFGPYPIYSLSSNQTDTNVKKLQQIKVNGIAKIDFSFETGRLDDNVLNPENWSAFKGIVVKDWIGNNIKEVSLTHDYSTVKSKRMILKEVSFKNFVNSKVEKYSLEYRVNYNPYSASTYIGKDYWGYFNYLPSPYIGNSYESYREVNPNFCTSDLLQKMSLPTGGFVIFDFEPNTYSYIGSTELTDFDANPNNWDAHTDGVTFNTVDYLSDDPNHRQVLFSITEEQDVIFSSSIFDTTNSGEYWLRFYRVTENSDVLVGSHHAEGDGTDAIQYQAFELKDLLPGTYKVSIFTTNIPPPHIFDHAQIYAYYKTRNENNYQFLYGGGNRISKISHYENIGDYNAYPKLPAKEKKYDYSIFGAAKSSGSLTYHVPKFDYERTKKECPHCENTPVYSAVTNVVDVTWKSDEVFWEYDVSTTFNNLNPVKTQGADVGYKNVKVFESDNGRIEYEYSSPIDVPEQIGIYNLSQPFMPTENYDYKRGLLKTQTVFNQSDKIISKEELTYDYENYLETTGFRTFYPQYDFINIYKHKYYTDYKSYLISCNLNPEYNGLCNELLLTDNCSDCFCYFGNPEEFISYIFIKEAYGWAKLISKTNKNYFYDSNNNQKVVQTNETYSYNPINKQISESTVTNSHGEVLKTKYFYHTGNSTYSQNRISEIEKIETYRGTELLSSSQINYSNNWSSNASFLPQSIVAAKSNATPENRIIYELYDENSNPLQLKQEGGTVISYIWGYNKTQPIAKIENATYAQVSSYVSNLQTLSNGTNETGLISALNAMRTALPNAMITTYTYIPLVGVHTITDPKGDTITYEYDEFNRLKAVYDKEGYKLAENDYHYRTQN
ncbi:MAG: RHS repeat protein [Flavobacteriales bacterium]|nr:RHS repeat protein [Flavobacteriales bacterium]